MTEQLWKEIKCKICGSQNKRLFMISPPQDNDDCFCEDCKPQEEKRRAKNDRTTED